MRKTYTSAISSIAILLSMAPATLAQHVITTIAGGVPNNVPALQAGVGLPSGVFRDSSGNLYITAAVNNAVFKVNSSGQLTTVAGNEAYGYSGDGGPATSAELADPSAVFVDGSGNIFIADIDNNRIREVVAATGNIQTVAGNGTYGFSGDGGPATSAALRDPLAVFVDGSGNIFIADGGNDRIREVIAATGNIQTVAGNGTDGFSGDGGPATSAELGFPSCIFLDGSGNLFICDPGNQRVREVIAATGNIQTVAGNGTYGFSGDGGPATSAALRNPNGVFVDGSGNIFFADRDNNRIREVVVATGNIQTVAGMETPASTFSGDGGPATSAVLYLPEDVYVDSSGNIFIADTGNNRVREVVPATGDIQTVAGNGSYGSSSGDGGPATSAQLNDPWSVFADGSGNIFIADLDNNRIREVVAATGNIQTVAGNGTNGFSGDGGPATSAALRDPFAVFVDGSGNIFIADGLVREVVAATGNIQTIAGMGGGYCDFGSPPCPPLGDGGPATNASLTATGVYVDGAGNIFIADNGNSAGFGGIREVIAATGIIRTVAMISSPRIQTLGGMSADGAANIFIAESRRVLKVIVATGTIQTVAGNGGYGFSGDGGPATSAALSTPTSVFVDSAGNIFIADRENHRIREVDAATGIIQTVAGDGTAGFSGDGGPAANAELWFPSGVWGDRQGNLLIADSANNRIRSVSGLVAVVSITVGPATATVSPGATQQFTASITKAMNTAVTWSLSGTGCPGSSCGTITPQGLYTAPSAVNGPLKVTVTATSVADDTKSATATVTVLAKQATSVAVASSANPSVLGQAVTLTATVSPSSGSGVPTGTVTFLDGTTTLGTDSLNSSGSATFTASSFAVAAHSITATYSGDGNFFGSNGGLTENVSYAICPLYDQTRSVNSGAPFPIKIYLCDASANDVSSAAVVLHATQVIGSGYTGAPTSPGNANAGSDFRFDGTLGPAGGYIFNLNTTGLASGTYSLQFGAGSDPVPHAVSFGVR